MTEDRALKKLQHGSEDALAWFITKYTPYVSTVVYNIIGSTMDSADIEEVTSDVFFVLWNNAKKIKPPSVRAYLGTVARNMAKNKLRDSAVAFPLEDDILLVDPHTPETHLEQRELNQAVRRAVLSMGQPDREIFLRFYYYCQPLADISEEMGINLSTVKTRLRRGREKLRNALTAYNHTSKEAAK